MCGTKKPVQQELNGPSVPFTERLYIMNLCLDQETQYREPVESSAMILGKCFWVQPPD